MEKSKSYLNGEKLVCRNKPFLLKFKSAFFIPVFSFVKPYLSPRHRWSLKLAWCTCGTSGFCNNQSRGNCAWFAVLCVTLQNGMLWPLASRPAPGAAGHLFLGSRGPDTLGKLRSLWGWVHSGKRTGKVFSEIAWTGGNRCLCQKRVVKILVVK